MFERYAIYYTAQGHLASHGAAWLGWDVVQKQSVPHPDLAGLDLATLTETPRKYGFHGTLKPPFRLAEGMAQADLLDASQTLASRLPRVSMAGLEVAALGRFLALVPVGEASHLREAAADVVRTLDRFRAPMDADELARRSKAHLSQAQIQHLHHWGYPHVMDRFRFHMTLSNRLPRAELPQVQEAAKGYFAPVLPRPFVLDALTLMGQRADGRFVTIERLALRP